MKPIIRTFLYLLVVSVLMPPLGAQAPKHSGKDAQTPAGGTFRSRAELVLVPAIVSDHSGHVSGLTKDDFIVLENGQEQKIATFEEVKPTTTPMRRAVVTPDGVYSNTAPETEEEPRRITILALDLINTQFADQAYARQQLVKYLSQAVNKGDLITLLTLSRSGVHVIHDFTTDTAVLAAALKKARGAVGLMEGENMEALYSDDIGSNVDARMAATEAGDIESLMNNAEAQMVRFQQGIALQATLDAFRGIAQAYAGVPGRKSLVWVTGSFPIPIPQPGDIRPGPSNTDVEDLFDQLNDANISVYPVDARGLVVGLPTAADRVRINPRNPGLSTINRLNTLSDSIATLRSFAEMTGGRAFVNTNDLAGAARSAAEDSASYYVLGYYRNTTTDTKTGWRKLKVKVRRSGLNVRHRDGFFVGVDKRTSEQRNRAEIAAAMRSPFNFTALPLAVKIKSDTTDPAGKPVPVQEGKHRVSFQVHVPGNALDIESDDDNHVECEFLAVAFEPTMSTADQTADHVEAHLKPDSVTRVRAGGLTYNNLLQLAPGDYRMRVVVRDDLSGKMGTVNGPVSVKKIAAVANRNSACVEPIWVRARLESCWRFGVRARLQSCRKAPLYKI